MNNQDKEEKVRLTATKEQGDVVDIRNLTDFQLKALGIAQLAYVKTILINGEQAFAIHAADGTPMAVADNEKTAFAAILQHELVPALVH
ncbi:hypothetical protein COMNV_01166 [Commensalibacter sp. Nvir]|uniref:DUF1150 family protein n=1 Tax=Commensalibacter sp. Nvir TaxID=3069817 RepID=UPI002D32731D|nr:hypothetical protein COMNV_01166 [Commensalibacter sp. Nvir]